MNKLILYCRPGFEKECAAEITDKANRQDVYGFARVKENSGYVIYECYQHDDADKLAKSLPVSDLIFTRQLFVAGDLLQDLPQQDRVTPIMGMLMGVVDRVDDLRVEVPDTNEVKELLPFCRKLTVPLRQAMREVGLFQAQNSPYKNSKAVHVFFIASGCCYVGYSYRHCHSPLYMGIMRLKFPREAPSRSTLKLEEAFHVFIPQKEWDTRLASGMRSVDLGASPGGWTYQLVQRSMWVEAVDNGMIAESLMQTGQVRHYRDDGFKFSPRRGNAYWLVCDMVEKPARVANLVGNWLIEGWCQEAIFNLKLPMKKRYETVKQILEALHVQLAEAGIKVKMQVKQLYHDREEVTVHVRRAPNTQK